MARHGGFGVAATITGGLIDSVATAYAMGNSPVFFPAPDTIDLGNGTTVDFAGIFEMLPLHIELHPNPGDLVTVHFSFKSSLRARYKFPGFWQPFVRYDVQISGAATLGLITSITNNQIQIGINTGSITFQTFSVKTTKGPALPAPVVNAVQSPMFAALVTAFIHTRPNIMITPPATSSVIERVQPGEFKDAGVSIFEWFRIRLNASRIVAKVLEGCISVGVDFAGLTNGDPSQLVDLTKVKGNGVAYLREVTPSTWEQGGKPYITSKNYPTGGSLAMLFNIDLMSQIMSSISQQTAHTMIAKNVELRELSLSYAKFKVPLYPGMQDGLRIGFKATTHPGDVNATGAFYIQPYITTYDGPTDFLKAPYWALRIAHSELDIPWYMDLLVFGIAAFAGVFLPFLLPVLAVNSLAVVDGVIPSFLDNARNKAVGNLETSVSGVEIPNPTSRPLPNLPGGTYGGTIHHISVCSEGLDTAISMGGGFNLGYGAIIAPDVWQAEWKQAIPVTCELSPAMAALGDSLMLKWEVFRAGKWDKYLLGDNVLIASYTKPYKPNVGQLAMGNVSAMIGVIRGVRTDTGTNGLLIGLRDPSVYYLNAIKVRCTATATLGSQTGEIWSDEKIIQIEENLDRHHKFVKWGPKLVYFENAGTGHKWWVHNRQSRIHRTAIGARCISLRQLASASPQGSKRPNFQYFDELPYAWDTLYANRHYLCEYCFFGGPDKSQPFPQEDWF